jgi:hypothetical protein
MARSRVADVRTGGLDKLVQEAREDPKFFHDLIYNTESVVGRLDYLSRQEKAGILSIDPDSLIVGIAGRLRPGGEVEVCGASCGGSCGATCAASCAGSCGASCGGSCQNSCAGTCGGSCGASCENSCAASCAASCVGSGDLPQFGQDVVLPEDIIADPVQAVAVVREKIGVANFSRFSRQIGQIGTMIG